MQMLAQTQNSTFHANKVQELPISDSVASGYVKANLYFKFLMKKYF